MNALLAWFSPARWIILGALLVGLVAGYFAWADHIGNVREAKVRAQYAAQAAKDDAKRDAIAAPIAAKQEAARTRVRTITKTILKEVPVYVKDTDCPMPGGFRVLHDAAANGEVPDPTRIVDAPGAAAGDVTDTVIENYGTYHEVAARLQGLQDWVRQQQQLK